MIRIEEVEMIKAITSLFIIKVRIMLKIIQAINETTRVIKNLIILNAVNKSFIFLLYHNNCNLKIICL